MSSEAPGCLVSLSPTEATAEIRDAQIAWEEAIGNWSQHSPEEVGAAAVRFYLAKRDLNAAITDPAEAAS